MRGLRGGAGIERRLERMRTRKLAGDDLHVRPQRANRARDAAGKAAAAEGNEYGFDCGRLRQYFEPDRGIAGQEAGSRTASM